MTETADSATPVKRCDLVMKGGITSGVVYPMAVVELAKEYRFESIGGTSAGAIAAVITAAAEYGRERGGFGKILKLPEFLSKNLLSLFQPAPCFRPLFGVMLAALKKEPAAVLVALVKGYSALAVAGLVLMAGMVLGLALVTGGLSLFALIMATIAGVAGLVLLPGYALYKDVTKTLPARDFGLCPGRTQPDEVRQGLCDWMADTIDEVAGLNPADGPLTIGMLWQRGIRLQTVTTDITTRRPYTLPLDENIFAYSPQEFRKIFPDRIVDFMEARTLPVGDDWGPDRRDLRLFRTDDLPVVVMARMSLSFPLLFTIVPLYRKDYTIAQSSSEPRLQRCLFSDGGVSSNFPVHFFDQFLPDTPTFGISLGSWRPERQAGATEPKDRVAFPVDARQGALLPTHPVKGLGGFFDALYMSAKDWQDSLQSVLVGYRERIVTVNLSDDEGGLNLDMPQARIEALIEYGRIAGQTMNTQFRPNDHRWRRFLTELPAIERALAAFARGWDARSIGPEVLDYPELVARGNERQGYGNLSADDLDTLLRHAENLAALGRELTSQPLPDGLVRKLPRQRTRLQNRPDMEHRPDPGNQP